MRFTIRDLLWLTLLAAVLVVWWMDRRETAEQMRELRAIVAFHTGYWATARRQRVVVRLQNWQLTSF